MSSLGIVPAQAATFTASPVPTISGSAKAYVTLTANPGTWVPAPDTFAYQWYRVSSAGTATPIAGATTKSYLLLPADVGFRVRVKVTAKKSGYTSASRTSGLTATVAAASVFSSTPTPTITGSAKAYVTLTANPGSWVPAPDKFVYQWYRVSSAGAATAISGATGKTYGVLPADVGSRLRVKVTGSKSGYAPVAKTSALTAAVVAASVFSSTPTPTISGTAKAYVTLTANPGSWVPAPDKFVYQWYRVSSAGAATAISGATGKTYGVLPADVGSRVRVKVTGSKSGYAPVAKTSALTAAVVAASVFSSTPTPTISGTAKADVTLTANPGSWVPAPDKFVYQWYRVSSAGASTSITGATAKTYPVPSGDIGYRLKVKVTATKSGHTPVSRTSALTATVGAASLTATPTPTVTGSARVAATLTATPGAWQPSPVALAFQWYRVTSSGSSTAIRGATKSTYLVQPADVGLRMKVTVTGSKSGYASVSKSSVLTSAVADATPGLVKISTVCAITSAGGLKCVDGDVLVDVSGLTSGVADVASGYLFTCAVTSAGAVKCWGENGSGQLGRGYTGFGTSVPVDVVGLSSGVVAVAAGQYHACAITSTGGLKCWGLNRFGQLGDGTYGCNDGTHYTDCTAHGGDRISPTPVDAMGLTSGVAGVTVGDHHTCAVTVGGAAKCWGSGVEGELGIDQSGYSPSGYPVGVAAPADVVGLSSGVVSVAAGVFHTCALTSAGAVKCWGRADQGQLGIGSIEGLTNADTDSPQEVIGLSSGVTAVASGLNHSCARTAAGGVKCWGIHDNVSSPPTPYDSLTPVDIPGLTSGIAAIASRSGSNGTTALTSDGHLKMLRPTGLVTVG